jgi:hypothetical protein
MRVRSSVFDSASERRAFNALGDRWAPEFTLYPSLPLSKLFELTDEDRNLAKNERRYFFATNVDYTICEAATGMPLLSIEFDGLGGGSSRSGRYVAERETHDPNRRWKLNFKLACARKVEYPLAVVSFDEVEQLDEDESFTILDGLVGAFLSKRMEDELIVESLEDARDELDEPNENERHARVEDIVLQAGVAAMMIRDPIERQAMDAEMRCASHSYRTESMFDPPLPVEDAWRNPQGLHANLKAAHEAQRVGARVVVDLGDTAVVRVVWMRNVGLELGIWPSTLVQRIARYLAFSAAAKLRPAATHQA